MFQLYYILYYIVVGYDAGIIVYCVIGYDVLDILGYVVGVDVMDNQNKLIMLLVFWSWCCWCWSNILYVVAGVNVYDVVLTLRYCYRFRII